MIYVVIIIILSQNYYGKKFDRLLRNFFKNNEIGLIITINIMA